MATDKGLQGRQLERLRDVLRKPDAVIFVGAGLSTWSGLPSWRDFLLELAAFIEAQGLSADLVQQEIHNNDLLQAAAYGLLQLTPPQQHQFLRAASRVDSATPSDAHRLLLELGPTCFITTNYDSLLERALSQWRPTEHYSILTNRQRVDLPTILQATATRFVFKPHGDLGDLSSIILTKDHYRQLLGPRSYVLDAMRTLLVTRPIVFVGFGLRDPDFLLVRDTLALTYKGGTQDHYALVPDPHPDEVRYWREAYGVHLIGYPRLTDVPSPPHAGFLQTLRALATDTTAQSRPQEQSSLDIGSDDALALVRLAARYRVQTDGLAQDQLPIRLIQREDQGPALRTRSHLQYGVYPDALIEASGPIIITGPPGAGKTFGALRAIRTAADTLAAQCLAEATVTWNDISVPLFVDLKLYDGELLALLQAEMPADLQLSSLWSRTNFRIFLDALDEVPQRFLDTGVFQAQLSQFLETSLSDQSAIVLLGRTSESIGEIDVPAFDLDLIDPDWVSAQIDSLPGERPSEEVLRILRRPMFFRLFREGLFRLDQVKTPAHIYRAYFDRIDERIQSTGLDLNITEILAPLAFEMIGEGRLTTLFARVVRQIQDGAQIEPDVARRVGETLMDSGFLCTLAKSRVMFLHQSFAEFLAATQLATIFQASTGSLSDLLRRHAWDHVLLLAASLLGPKDRRKLLAHVVRVDPEIALRALQYVDGQTTHSVEDILLTLANLPPDDASYFYLVDLMESLPVEPVHREVITELMDRRDVLAGGGAALLLALDDRKALSKVMDLLVAHRDDYNSCTAIGRALAPYVTGDEVQSLVDRVTAVDQAEHIDWASERGVAVAVSSAIAESLKTLSPSEVFKVLDPATIVDRAAVSILVHWLWEGRTIETFIATKMLVSRGIRDAIFPLYGHIRWGELSDQALETAIDQALLEQLVDAASDERWGKWSLAALLSIGVRLPRFRSYLARAGRAETHPLLRLGLLIAAAGGASSELEAEVNSALRAAVGEADIWWQFVPELELDWSRYPSLLCELAGSENPAVVIGILSPRPDKEVPRMEISDVGWWLQHMALMAARDEYAAYCLGQVIAISLNRSNREELLQAFDSASEDIRTVIAMYILPWLGGISTSDLSERGASFLLAHLSDMHDGWWPTALGELATEDFVEGRLIPLLDQELPLDVRSGLVNVLRQAGDRHRRRYLSSSGELLG